MTIQTPSAPNAFFMVKKMENYKVNTGISVTCNSMLPRGTIICSEDIYFALLSDEDVKFKGSILEHLKHEFKKDKLRKKLEE